jgi:hypothetical protein
MATHIKRLRQLAFKEESTAGTAETLVATDAAINVINPEFTPNPVSFERVIAGGSLSKDPKTFPAGMPVELTFGIEISGNSNNTTATGDWDSNKPKWSSILEACGFAESIVDVFTLASVTDEYQHLELVSDGTNTATIVTDTFSEHTVGYVVTGSSITTGTWTGQTSGATGTASSNTDGKRLIWTPTSTFSPPSSVPTLTIGLNLDGDQIKVKGCRGTFDLVFEFGRGVTMNVTMQGIFDSVSALANYTDAAIGAKDAYLPPVFLGLSNFLIEDEDGNSMSSCDDVAFNNLSISMGNDVVARECAIDTDGYSMAEITDRTPTGSFTPDYALDATFPWIDNFRQGKLMRMTFDVGTTVGNIWTYKLPWMQIESLTDTDRDGVSALDVSFALTSGQYTLTDTAGANNELAIMYTD